MISTNDLGVVLSKGDFKPLDTGDYDAVVHAIISLGMKPVEYQGQQKNPQIYIKVVVEIPSLMRDDGQTVVAGRKIKVTDSVEKGNFAKFLRALGVKVDDSNIMNYFSKDGLTSLLGKPVIISVDKFVKEGKDVSYISEFARLDPRLPDQPKPQRDPFIFMPMSSDLSIFKNNLTYNTQKEVMEALNVNQFPKELHEMWKEIEIEKGASAPKKPTPKSSQPTELSDDDLPFDLDPTYDTNSIE